MEIRKFQDTVRIRDLEWDPENKLGYLFRGVELAGEVGELCNELKKLERERLGLRGSRTNQQKLEEEIGDAFITLVLVANAVCIDLENAAIQKFNASSKKLGLSTVMK